VPCYQFDLPNGGRGIMCGKLGAHCSRCARLGEFLCDYPVGKGWKGKPRTCDANLCEHHAHEIALDLHYCPGHYEQWQEFRDDGGVSEHLQNVIAFKHEKERNDG
jgi:hypothetical protein